MKDRLPVLLMALLLSPTAARGDAIIVRPDPGAMEFSSIQDGISAASSGDTVLVMPGRYRECIDFLGKRHSLGEWRRGHCS